MTGATISKRMHVALGIAVAAAVVACGKDKPGAVTTTTSTTSTTSVTSTTAGGVQIDPTDAVFPDPAGKERYNDPVTVARDFVTGYLGFRAPIVGTYDGKGGVPVQATSTGPATSVRVNQLQDGYWWVTGAVSDEIELTEPKPATVLTSPVHLVGKGRAFEGHINVSVRKDEGAAVIGTGFVTGGGDILRPFKGDIAFDPNGAKFGSIVLYAQGGENGDLTLYATVFRVRFA
jgi:hypothetical protein